MSGRERLEGRQDLVQLTNLTDKYRFTGDSHSDILSLYRRGLLDGDAGFATRLTDRCKDEGQRLVGLFSVPSILRDAEKAKD